MGDICKIGNKDGCLFATHSATNSNMIVPSHSVYQSAPANGIFQLKVGKSQKVFSTWPHPRTKSLLP